MGGRQTRSESGKLASYSVAKYGPQQDTDWQWMPDAGNGVRANGSLIVGNPDDASTTSTAADAKAWVSQIVAQRGLASPTNPAPTSTTTNPGFGRIHTATWWRPTRPCSSTTTGWCPTERRCGPPTPRRNSWGRRAGDCSTCSTARRISSTPVTTVGVLPGSRRPRRHRLLSLAAQETRRQPGRDRAAAARCAQRALVPAERRGWQRLRRGHGAAAQSFHPQPVGPQLHRRELDGAESRPDSPN